MIYTLTLNPAIDYYIDMNKFEEGELNKVNNAYTLPGGKGINVSKVLKNFEVESVALGFYGGFTGNYIKTHLKDYGIKNGFIELEEDTRINIKLKTDSGESEISGKSPNISNKNIEELFKLIGNIKENDTLMVENIFCSPDMELENSWMYSVEPNTNQDTILYLPHGDHVWNIDDFSFSGRLYQNENQRLLSGCLRVDKVMKIRADEKFIDGAKIIVASYDEDKINEYRLDLKERLEKSLEFGTNVNDFYQWFFKKDYKKSL
ncbi:PfkB family carbohydrate kinase [uncultured Brachyspira sp.]|uniref:PfkB family carbohydrate kinase n=1 Tax=uncultured Brachyspira sp. TaxID=221953 RepID=UPI0025850DF2|nr:PfkB family carbohydrate kinase [uncultured Brachyspira sp.]